jgi:hypothetical protein
MSRVSVADVQRSLARLQAARLVRWCMSADGVAGLILLALALALRVYWSRKLLQFPDAMAYADWGHTLVHHFFDFYSFGGTTPSWWLLTAYPPVANYLYGIVDLLFVGFGHLLGHPSVSHDLNASPWLDLAVKMPAIIADLVLTAIIYLEARRHMARPWAWLVAALFAFSPFMFLDVEVWGQTDGIVAMAVVVAILLTIRQHEVWAAIVLALIVNFKPQPVVFVPLVLVYVLRQNGWRPMLRAVAAFTGTTLVVWLPYLLPPRFEIRAWRANLARLEGIEGVTATHGAENFWALLGKQSVSTSYRLHGLLTVTQAAVLLFAGALMIVLVLTWRDRSISRLWASAAFIALASYYFLPLQFPRYLIPAVSLLLLAALFDRRYWLPFTIVFVTTTINQTQEFFGCHCEVHNYWTMLAPLQALVFRVNSQQVAAATGVALLATTVMYIWTKPASAPSAGTSTHENLRTDELHGTEALSW